MAHLFLQHLVARLGSSRDFVVFFSQVFRRLSRFVFSFLGSSVVLLVSSRSPTIEPGPGICFFKHVTQQELKHGIDAAAACDESGKCTTNDELAAESPVIFLGRPVGFVASVSNLNLGFFGVA